ncbi:hypothetical protein [Mycobacterium sp. 94-17]|uniref:hypothetical protein n=1 Tax=Mycobacterium sp. 94-17 TaxID=2986147 RepID=UPI002D1E4B92|nr:hypothetical protein [Mycobacterium sp. 94-17]MEB4211304.1 hypothetical protein [Mycobacterium sp. 94-17]
MADLDTDDEDSATGLWIWTSVLLLATVGFIALGVLSARGRQPSPTENLLMSVILTAISVGAGWALAALVDRTKAKREKRSAAARKAREQQEIQRNALSSVRRIFNLMDGFGRIEGLALSAVQEDPAPTPKAEMLTIFRVIAENARTQREQARHSIQDWRYFAPDAIDEEYSRLRASREQTVEEDPE